MHAILGYGIDQQALRVSRKCTNKNRSGSCCQAEALSEVRANLRASSRNLGASDDNTQVYPTINLTVIRSTVSS